MEIQLKSGQCAHQTFTGLASGTWIFSRKNCKTQEEQDM